MERQPAGRAGHHVLGEVAAHRVEHLSSRRPTEQVGLVGPLGRQRRGAGGRPRVGREQLDEVPLLLGHASTDGGQLVRANRARQVRPRLTHAADAPLQRLLHEPPVERGAVDRSAAGALVGREQLVDRADAADLVRRAEAPCLHAQPGQVLHGVTDVHQLPVDDGGEAFAVDDDVAHAQVAVHQRRRRARRTVGLEPRVGLLEGRAAIGHHAVRRPVARQLVDLGHAGHLRRIDRVQTREERAELVDEHVARAGELVVAQDPARERLARHCAHHQPGGAEVRAVVVEHDLGHAQSPLVAGAHGVGFQLHRARQARPAGRIAPQDERPSGGAERPRLAGCAAAQPLQVGDLDRSEDRCERGGELFRCRRWCRRGSHR